MAEESVIIPVKMELEESDLQSLKSSIEKTFEDIKKYSEIQGTKKEPYAVQGIKELSDEASNATANIVDLQAQFKAIEQSTPFDGLKNTQKQIRDIIKDQKDDVASINSLWSRYGNISKEIKRNEEEKKNVIQQQTKAQKDYKAEIDRVNKAYAKPAKVSDDPQKQAQAEIEAENKRRKALADVERYYKNINKELKSQEFSVTKTGERINNELDKVKSELATRRESLANSEASLKVLRAQASEEGRLLKNAEYLKVKEQERLERLDAINKKLLEQEEIVSNAQYKAEKNLAEDKSATGYKPIEQRKRDSEAARKLKADERELAKAIREAAQEDRNRVQAYNEEARIRNALHKEEMRRIKEEEKAKKDQTKEFIRGYKEEVAAAKQSASQYYYRLRAIKMVGFTVKQMSSTIDAFSKKLASGATKALSAYLRLIPGVNALRKAFDKTHASQKKFNSEMKKTSKNTNVANMSLGKFVLQTMKALIGVRSLYMLMRKLRTAVGEGFKSMAVQLEDVNAQLSSIVSSFNYMKASVTAVVQPVLVALAPALERLADAFERVTYYASSFIATLTGQDFVYRAIRVETDYAESLDKTAKSAKNAAKELGKYDKLNVIKKDNEDDNTGGMQWEKVPLDDTIKDWTKKFKEFFDKLFSPFKKAWNKFKRFFLDSWKYALNEVIKLGKDIARDFWEVWESTDVYRIFENLLLTVAYIGLVVGNLAKNFRKAWNVNKNGYRILKSIAKIMERITEYIRRAAEFTVKWSSELSFIPLLTSLADNLERKLVPAIDKVLKLVEYLYELVMQHLVKALIESGLPQIIDIIGDIIETVGILADKLKESLERNDVAISILTKIKDIFQIIVDKIKECSEKTKEWAENINFDPLLQSISRFLDDIKPAVQFIVDTLGKFWTDVLLPFYDYLVEKGFPLLLDTLGEQFNKANWPAITENMENFFKALEPFFELAWETLVQVVSDLTEKILDFAGSREFGELIEKFKDWINNANPEDLANSIEILAGVVIGAKGSFKLLSDVVFPLISAYGTVRNLAMQAKLIEAMKNLQTVVGDSESTGLIYSLGTLALKLGLIAGALADIYALFEFNRQKEIHEQIKALPQTASDLNGVYKELSGIQKVYKKIWEFLHPGETLADYIVIPSDYEKLETMKDHLINMNDELENSGKLTELTGMQINQALDIWLAHDEKMEELTDDEVEEFSRLYKAVEDYYTTVTGNEAVMGSIKDVGNEWEKITEKIPDGEQGRVKGTELATGVSTGINEGMSKANWEKIPDFLPGEKEGKKSGEVVAKTIVTTANSDLEKSYPEWVIGGENIIKGVDDGATKQIDKTNTDKWWNKLLKSIKSFFKIGSPSKVMEGQGKYIIQGLDNGISKESSNTDRQIRTLCRNILSTLKSNLSRSTIVQYAKNVFEGFESGINSVVPNILRSVSGFCNDIIDTIVDIFDIHSPSKVMRGIGENIIQGLDRGVEEESDKDLIPTDFTDTFIDALTDMKVESLDIVTSMLDELSAKFEGYNMLSDFSSKVNSIKVPDIAIGSVLPANVAFKSTNTHTDENELKQAIQNAISEAFSSLDFNSNKEPIMLQLDKKMVAEAVWDETEKRYKQRGSYSPMYR